MMLEGFPELGGFGGLAIFGRAFSSCLSAW
jgi:hypothetical protein